jgi:hypothetical protein
MLTKKCWQKNVDKKCWQKNVDKKMLSKNVVKKLLSKNFGEKMLTKKMLTKMLTPKKFLLIRSMQVKDNHFYRKLSVMLIYNKFDDVIRYDVISYDVIIDIFTWFWWKKMMKWFAYRWELKMKVKRRIFELVESFPVCGPLPVHFRFPVSSFCTFGTTSGSLVIDLCRYYLNN